MPDDAGQPSASPTLAANNCEESRLPSHTPQHSTQGHSPAASLSQHTDEGSQQSTAHHQAPRSAVMTPTGMSSPPGCRSGVSKALFREQRASEDMQGISECCMEGKVV